MENEIPIRVSRLADQSREADLMHLTPGERMALVWQRTVDAWAFKGVEVREQDFRRDIGRIIHGKEVT